MKQYLATLLAILFIYGAQGQDYVVLPDLEYGQVIDNQSSYIPISVTLEEEGEEIPYTLSIGNEPTSLDDLEKDIKKYIYRHKEQLNDQLPVMLRIDKDIPYKFYAELRHELKRMHLNRVVFQVSSKDQAESNKGIPVRLATFYDSVNEHYASKKGIKAKKAVTFKHIMDGMPQEIVPPPSPKFPAVTRTSDNYRKYMLKITAKGKMYIGYETVDAKAFYTEFDRKLTEVETNSVIVRLDTEDEVTFAKYLNTLAEINAAVKNRNLTIILADYSFIELNYIEDMMKDE
jgi:biopolymer transport protein ExbD